MRWPGSQTLRALLPFYDPTLEQPLTISPLSDLALALAEDWSRQGDEDLFQAYEDAARRIGTHFGFEDPARTLMRATPAHPGVASGGLSDSVRFMIALACLAEQARGMGCEVLDCETVDISRGFTALHLVEMYRKDAEDGVLDGRVAGAQVTQRFPGGVEAAMPVDLFRLPLASACARWLLDPNVNQSGISLGLYARQLEDLALNQDTRLFGPPEAQLPVRPFDEAGPRLRVWVEAIPGESRVFSRGDGPALLPTEDGLANQLAVTVTGRVRLVVEAEDEVGVATTGEGGPPAIFMELVGDLPRPALIPSAEPAAVGIRRVRRATATLETRHLPEIVEGQRVAIRVRAIDLLGNEAQAIHLIDIDRRPPSIAVGWPAGIGMPNADAGRHDLWYTNADGEQPRFQVSVRDRSPVHVRVAFADDAPELDVTEDSGALERALFLRTAQRGEGVHSLHVRAEDVLGHVAETRIEVHIDRTPPELVFEPTRYFDERFMQPTCDGDGCRLTFPVDNPHVAIPGENPNPFRKIHINLFPGADNLPTLAMRVSDPPGCGDCPQGRPTTEPGQLHLMLGDFVIEPERAGSDLRTLAIDEQHLGLDGLVPAGTLWPEPGTALVLRDLAGNERRIPMPLFSLEILPPPLVVQALPPAGGDRVRPIRTLDLAGLIDAVQTGSAVQLGRWQISNPWPVPVAWFIATPEPVTLRLDTVIEPEWPGDVVGPDPAAFASPPFFEANRIEGCVLQDDPFHIGPGQPRLVPNPSVEAARVEERYEVLNGRRTRILEAFDCRPRMHTGVFRPTAEVAWDVGRLVTGSFRSLSQLGSVDLAALMSKSKLVRRRCLQKQAPS